MSTLGYNSMATERKTLIRDVYVVMLKQLDFTDPDYPKDRNDPRHPAMANKIILEAVAAVCEADGRIEERWSDGSGFMYSLPVGGENPLDYWKSFKYKEQLEVTVRVLGKEVPIEQPYADKEFETRPKTTRSRSATGTSRGVDTSVS